ncbi:hypothetical protein E2C01_026962 [Portunus trituberculatus]|uniref:Uncharacterized protein n=1 Tax=Portunus trituberculatus TaxID=210409 RepID=A0A5B7EK38_PORTR|nr:hypothetical protein [Portunus trituberculatus]
MSVLTWCLCRGLGWWKVKETPQNTGSTPGRRGQLITDAAVGSAVVPVQCEIFELRKLWRLGLLRMCITKRKVLTHRNTAQLFRTSTAPRLPQLPCLANRNSLI